MPSTTLSISGLDLIAGPRTLASGLDLVASDGDVVAVVGPNGSGKSTLLRTVAGQLPVVTGGIRLAPPTASVGWLPQEIPDPRESLLAMARRRTGVEAADAELDAAFVRGHAGPVLIASHDRAFLDEVATQVVELDLPQQRIGHYPGGWSDYVEAKELARRHAWEAYEEYSDTRDRLLAQARQRAEFGAKGHRAVRRGDEADKHLRERDKARADRQLGKAARAKAAVERLEEVPQPRKEWQLRYRLLAGAPSAEVVASLADAVVVRGSFRLGPVSLSLDRGDRVAVLGDNGSGKSTLLDALFGRLELARGRVTAGARVRPLHLDQRRSLLDSDGSVADLVAAELGEPDRGDVRTLLAKFGLGADHVDRPASSLSLGERTRALMAIGQGREVNLLVLDEPTNHLDVAAIEELEQAVAGFEGTVVVVSHDRRLLERLGINRTWRLVDGQVIADADSDLTRLTN